MEQENNFKVAILPCNGIGRLVSTIVRQAGYRIVKQRPDDTVLLSSGAVIADVPEQKEYADKYPVIVINGCRPRCASAIMERKGKKPAVVINVPEVMAERKIVIAGEKRTQLGERGFKLVDAVVEITLQEVDKVLAEEMLSTL
jgi:uncharacterized metal-binding protein